MNNIMLFIKWALARLFKYSTRGIVKKHQKFKLLMEHHFLYSVFCWAAFTVMALIATVVSSALLFPADEIILTTAVRLTLFIGFMYILLTGTSVLYDQYNAEQEAFMDQLTNPRQSKPRIPRK